MAKNETGGAEPTGAEGKPIDMTGFTLLQIIAWTNQVIVGCKDQLEEEKKSSVLAHLQGQIPGCKFALNALKEQYHLSDDFMGNTLVCNYANLSFEQLLGAMKDIERMEAEEAWTQFLSRIEAKATEMKEYLLHSAKASRDLFVRQGKYNGMTTYHEVFDQIEESLNYRKTREPLFNQETDEYGDTPPEDPGTAIVPAGSREVGIRDEDIPPDDSDDDEYEEDPDLGDFPVEGDPDR
jgi:hypothetical protein